MQTSFTTTPVLSALIVVLAVGAATWWLSVPGLMTFSTFAALSGILVASAWIVKSTCENARPSSSLAQSLYDVETAAAANRARRG